MAINSPLLDMSIEGAQGVVFTITGGTDLGMEEVNEAAKVVTASADEEAKVIFGAVIDENMKDNVKITVIATGFDNTRSKSLEDGQPSYYPSNFIEEEQKKEVVSSYSNPKKKVDWNEKNGVESGGTSEDDSEQEKEVDDKEKPEKKSKRKIFSSIEEAQSQPLKESQDEKKRLPKKDEEEDDDELSVPAFIRKKMK